MLGLGRPGLTLAVLLAACGVVLDTDLDPERSGWADDKCNTDVVILVFDEELLTVQGLLEETQGLGLEL